MICFNLIVLQVENWCPRLPWRAKNPNEETDQKTVVRKTLKHECSVIVHSKDPGSLCHINASKTRIYYCYSSAPQN